MNKLLLSSALLLLTTVSMSGCFKRQKPSSSIEEPSVVSSEEISSEEPSSEVISSEEISSEDISSEEISEEPSSALPEWVDYADSEDVRLNLDYKGHDFYADGIGEVTLKTPIDGDTAHFNPVVTTTSNQLIKSRFWGIDTPESTGRIEEWGKGASNYTKKKLQEASKSGTIVVSTPREDYGVPSADSTGQRYVSLIWISTDTKHADYKDLRLLNLMIVQDGYSYVKNVSDVPAYQAIFIAAEKQASNYKLHLWSGEPDPDYNYGSYETTSILDLKHYMEKVMEGQEIDPEESFDGAKVRVVGTVAGISDGTLYLQNFFTVEQGGNGNVENPYSHELGEYAGINIFCGMSSVPSKYTTPNTYIEICGTVVVSEVFGFQLTGAEGHFPPVESLAEEDDCHILIKAVDNTEDYQLNTFEYTSSQLDSHVTSSDIELKYESFYCSTKLSDVVTVTKFYKNANNEITLTFGSHKFQAYITGLYRGNPHVATEYWTAQEQFVGKSFYVKGIFAAYTGGTTNRFQFVFQNVSEELLCTDYYNADGTLIEE